jgi:hypothetical protein
MAAAGEFGSPRLGKAAFEHDDAGPHGARVERARQMLGMKGRAVDRLLQVHAVMDVVQQQRLLILLVAARRAEGEVQRATAARTAFPDARREATAMRARGAIHQPNAARFRPRSSMKVL